jgi:chromosome segregation ATPase
MKFNLFVLFIFLVFTSCHSKKEKSDEPNEPAAEGGLELLEEEVNKIHEEVMPKMSDLYKWKNKLKDLDSIKSISPEKKKEIQSGIQKIDSAYDGMMNWMHEFKPEEHRPNEEAAREYLEDQMQKIQQVKEDIQEAIEKANSVVGENEGKRQ